MPPVVRPPTSVADLMALKPGAYWAVFARGSLAFKFACIYLMFEYVRPQSIYTQIDFLPYGVLSLAGGVIAVVFSKKERAQKVLGSKLAFLLVFLSFVLITILFSQFPGDGIQELPLLLSWILAYYLITKAVNTQQRFVVFYMLFLLFSLKMSQHGFRSWVSSGFGFNKEGVSGAPGWFANSGEVGIQMCIFIPMAMQFIWAGWKTWKWWQRLLMLSLPFTAVGTVIGSSSRGAVIGTAAAMLWFLMKSRYRIRGFIALAAVGLLVMAVLPDQFSARFDTMGEDNSSKLRLEYWDWGWETMKEHPIFGIGYFNWLSSYSQHLVELNIHRPAQVCHNIFIQAGSELGFVGLGMVLILIISTFVLNARTRRLAGPDDAGRAMTCFSHGLDAGMVGFLVSAQFVTVLYYPYLWIAVALTVALHNAVGHSSRQSRVENSGRASTPATFPTVQIE
jgi:putative inorganic carbon (HCO3(-)) transporter